MIRNIIGFPGLSWSFTIKETAFTVFGLSVQWYGIILTTGIVLAFIWFLRKGTKVEHIKEDHILNATLIAVPVAIIGARITYVLTNLDKYDSFADMINIRNGGIAVYGSIIFGILAMYIYSRVKKLSILSILDAAATAEMLGQIIGRWGNFCNGEAYGFSESVSKLPWRMTIQEQKLVDGSWVDYGNQVVAHPTFLYESLWNLIGFIIINLCYRKKKFQGQIVLMYLAWYGLGRGLIEILRTDSCLGLFGEKVFVWLGLGSFVVCTALLVILLVKKKKEADELGAYTAAYGASAENSDIAPSETVLDPYDTEEPDTAETGDIPENDITPDEPEEDKHDGDNT